MDTNDRNDVGTENDQPTSDATVEDGILERLEELGLIDDPEMACKMFDVFLESCGDLHAKLEDSLQQSDPKLCRMAAHTLKGSSRSMGAMRLGELWFDLQKRADDGDLTDARELIAAAKTEFARVEKFLLELKADLSA